MLLHFDGYELNVVSVVGYPGKWPTDALESRGILRDGYLYVVSDHVVMTVVDLSVPYGEEGHIVKTINAK